MNRDEVFAMVQEHVKEELEHLRQKIQDLREIAETTRRRINGNEQPKEA